MSGSRQRQLAGLAPIDRATIVPPPARKERQKDTAPESANDSPANQRAARHSPKSTTAGQPARDGKHRRAVTVPTPLVELLRQRAQELDRYQTDLILDCLAVTAAALEREHEADSGSVESPFHRPRRRAHRGRTVTTLTLYLTGGEVQAMDALANRLGLSRSAVIAIALDRGLDQLP